MVLALAVEGDLDPALIRSNLVEIPWPPRSGRLLTIPEIDRAAWFSLADARTRVVERQAEFLDRLEQHLGSA